MSFEQLNSTARTLRFRLMLWNALAVILTGIVVLSALREGVRLALIQEIDEVLHEDVAEIALQFHDEATERERNSSWQLLKDELNRKARSHNPHAWFVHLIAADGSLYWASDAAPDHALYDAPPSEDHAGSLQLYRFVKREIPPNASPVRSVCVGCTQAFISRDMSRIDRLVLLVGGFVLIVAPLGGYWLAGRATQATIGSHTVKGTVALQQLDMIALSGYIPERFIWIHTQMEDDFNLHLEVARRGAWVEYDAIGDHRTDEDYISWIQRLIAAGLEGHILLSHDRGWYDPSQPNGGIRKPYTYISEVFLPKLRAAGVAENIIHQLTHTNPFRAYAR